MDPNNKLKIPFPSSFPNYPSSSFPLPSIDNPVHFQFDSPVEPKFLQGNPIPPFLSKTFDLVDDPSLDCIISWGGKGDSFVVWEPADFAIIVLRRNFKHDNFSSFVRQLNTYGFRKIDAHKWEFAHQFFLKGNKHLLKNIRRRRSRQPQQVAGEVIGPEMETELEKLKMEKSVIVREMAELQQKQHETAERVETIKRRLQASEQRQKQMVFFVSKTIQDPEFIERVVQMKKQRLIGGSPNVSRKTELDCLKSSEIPSSLPQHYFSQEIVPVSSDNLADGEFSNLDFGAGMSSSKFDSWSNVGSYNFPVNGHFFSGELSDPWDLCDIQEEGRILEMKNWQSDESPVNGCWE